MILRFSIALLVVLTVIASFCWGAARAARWIKNDASPRVREIVSVSLTIVLVWGLMGHFSLRVAVPLSLLLGGCVAGDLLKRRGLLGGSEN